MTETTISRIGAPLAHRQRKPLISRLLAALIERFRVSGQIRRDLAYLQSCDDRTLADIGLSRGQIEQAVRFGRYY